MKCTHTKGNRTQECILVLVEDRMACIPIAPAENVAAKIVGGLAMTAIGVDRIRLGNRVIDVSHLATTEDLAAAVEGACGFYVEADWTYRTKVPVIGTMLMHANETITTRDRVPAEMLAKLTPNRAPASSKPVKIACAIGGAVLVGAVIAYAATGSLELLFGIGFWGVLIIATSVFAWVRLRRVAASE